MPRMTLVSKLVPLAFAGWVGLAAAAAAAEVQAPATVHEAPTSQPEEFSALAIDDLEAISGGSLVVALSEQDLTATNTGNTVIADTLRNGDIAFTSGALNGFAGVGNFVVNTGNNNNLQGAISINIISGQ